MKTNTLVLLSAILLAACDTEADAPGDAHREAEVSAVSPSDWKVEARQRAEAVRAADPAGYAAVSGLRPIRTRKGTPRFVGELLRDPAAADVLLGRLVEGEDDPMLRAALVEALPRTGGHYGTALVSLLSEESDADVRVVMVAALERADALSARAGLSAALHDADPSVRAEAARVTSMRADGDVLAAALEGVLDDEASQVRAAAAHSLGVLESTDARDALLGGLDDADPVVRLESLRGLERIDPAFTASLPQLSSLQSDDDARVARVAARVTRSE